VRSALIQPSKKRVIIIGAGFGGLQAARGLARAPVEVVVIDRRNHHLFQPLLYQVATAGLAPSEIAYPIRAILRRQTNARVLMDEAVAVDLPNRQVVLKASGAMRYDFLILAPGAVDFYFGHEDWRQYARGLKRLEDAVAIRREILLTFENAERACQTGTLARPLTIVLIGAGPTGVELAGAVAELAYGVAAKEFRFVDLRQAKIILIEAANQILPSMDAGLAAWAEAELKRLGVEVRTGKAVTSIGPNFVCLDSERIDADLILWTAGVAGSPLLKTLGVPLARGGRVPVEADLSVPGYPEVFVIGDAAYLVDRDQRPIPGLAPAAIQQGRHVARNILNALENRPSKPFHYIDKGSLVVVGRARAIADLGRLKFRGFLAWLLWVFVHIFYLIGFRNRLLVLTEWAWAFFTRQSGSRLITEYGFDDRQRAE